MNYSLAYKLASSLRFLIVLFTALSSYKKTCANVQPFFGQKIAAIVNIDLDVYLAINHLTFACDLINII